MNVIFLDFDGVLDTNYYQAYGTTEEKIKILADICHTYDAKVVIEAAAKEAIDEELLTIDSKSRWVLYLFYLFNKYDIEVIGRTSSVRKYEDNEKRIYTDMWKEDEIRLYLMRHPEIEHYCVIDDDDLLKIRHRKSDLDKVREHLVSPDYYNDDNPQEEGLQPYHKEMVGEALKKENEVRRLILKYSNKTLNK